MYKIGRYFASVRDISPSRRVFWFIVRHSYKDSPSSFLLLTFMGISPWVCVPVLIKLAYLRTHLGSPSDSRIQYSRSETYQCDRLGMSRSRRRNGTKAGKGNSICMTHKVHKTNERCR